MATVVGVRPNIRIEIQNNVNESMEVDNEEKEPDADMEDGEISDKNDTLEPEEMLDILSNKPPLTTSTNLNEHLSHSPIVDQDTNTFLEDEMPKLLSSLGITPENEQNVRFDALFMRGTENMILDDIFKYFRNYQPTFVEWINSESCSVIFPDNITAAKALYFTSKTIRGYPNKTDETTTGKSILLINKEREVEMQGEDMVVLSNNDDDSVNISDISTPMPEGHWRLGLEHPKAKCVFIRFTLNTDKKNSKLEQRQRNLGNPKYGGMIGLISESRKLKIKGIFDRNKDINNKPEDISKNPWGDLAENWYSNESIEQPPPLLLKPVVKQEVLESQKYDVLNRLGTKRRNDDSNGSDQENKKKGKIPRMRMYADEEEAKIKRKKRLQAVKMYTISLEDAKQHVPDLRNIIRTAYKIKSEKQTASEVSDYHSDVSDLGKTLKNRLKKRNYRNSRLSNERDETTVSIKEEPQFETVRNQRQSEEDRNIRETDRYIRERERQLDNFRNKSPPPLEKHKQNRHRKDVPSHKTILKHDYNKSKYRNRMHSDKQTHKRSRSSRQNRHSRSKELHPNKTKSKVEVVNQPKKPVVASTVWSRIDNTKKERLKTASERLKGSRDRSPSTESSNESSSSSTSSSSTTSSSESSSESEDTNDEVVDQATQGILKSMDRPGFKTATTQSVPVGHYKKSPLRIEISNDHFKN